MICEPTVYKMWGPRRLTTVWAFMACYRYSFTLYDSHVADFEQLLSGFQLRIVRRRSDVSEEYITSIFEV
jgi:hypothetical protein